MPKIETVKLKEVVLGEGRPKICIPLTAKTKEELIVQARIASNSCADLIEWRADLFLENLDRDHLLFVLDIVKKSLGSIPLLFTCRTKKEGGGKNFSETEYANLNQFAAESGLVDLVDIEAFFGQDQSFVKKMIETIHSFSTPVIASNHEFHKTPSSKEMVERMCFMQEIGADIVKLAVMPVCAKDVLSLLCATEEMVRCFAVKPIVTMSMGKEGIISRICGEIFGSALTFGAIGECSAPGQLPADKLKEILMILHEGN